MIVWFLVEKMRPCFWKLKHVCGHQSHFCKIGLKWVKIHKLLNNFASFSSTEMSCTILEMAQKSGPNGINHFWIHGEFAILVIFSEVLDRFCKNGSGDHIHAPNFENRASFFPQGTKLSAQNVFIGFWLVQGSQKYQNVPNFGLFFILLL